MNDSSLIIFACLSLLASPYPGPCVYGGGMPEYVCVCLCLYVCVCKWVCLQRPAINLGSCFSGTIHPVLFCLEPASLTGLEPSK